jgi:dTMP kinase
LVRALTRPDRPAPLHLREPGSTRAGEALRAILLARDMVLGPASETLLFAAARRQMLDELVAPALEAGRDVVCERFHASTFAYQAVGGALPPDQVLSLLEQWAGHPAPDLELILELDVARAAERRGAATDRIEDKGLTFQQRVAEGYRRYAARIERARLVDGSGSPQDVAQRILEVVQGSRRGAGRVLREGAEG